MELRARLDKIKAIIEQDSFFNQQSLGGELNFHIFDYEPSDELIVRRYIKDFVSSYSYANSKIKPIEFDLFEMLLKILTDKTAGSKTYLDLAIETEERQGTESLINTLRGVINIEEFVNMIKKELGDSNLVILSGVGKVYPLVRSHNVLNNLHAVLDRIPVIMFYPGTYDQKELRLFKGSNFDGLKDDNYYRAFRLVANE